MSERKGLWTISNVKTKTDEELEKERQVMEKYEETQNKLKSVLENRIEEIKQDDFVKYALKILNEPNDKSYEKLSQETQESLGYESKAEKIAQYILKKKESRLKTSSGLSLLEMRLDNLASFSDSKIHNFPEEFESAENEDITKRTPLPPLPPLQSPTPVNFLPKTPHYLKNEPLRKLAEKIKAESDKHYNTQPIKEHPTFTSDEDENATPLNFFTMKRIEEFIRTLPDDQTKLFYLRAKEQQSFDEDPRGFIKKDGNLVFPSNKVFLQKLKKLISIYEKTFGSSLGFHPIIETEGGETENSDEGLTSKRITNKYKFTVAQKVKAILYLLQSSGVKIDANANLSEIARFICAITGNNDKNIYDLIRENDKMLSSKKNGKKEILMLKDKFISLRSNVVNTIDNDFQNNKY